LGANILHECQYFSKPLFLLNPLGFPLSSLLLPLGPLGRQLERHPLLLGLQLLGPPVCFFHLGLQYCKGNVTIMQR
jgi:hypothetical protein